MTASQKLTKRELQIVKLICNGMSDGEIAQHLTLSPSTIRTHRKKILSKLDLKKTVLLVRYAYENKLIS
ncbi:MAG: response regulator transcription factor [Bacteroidetes bacterium]|jgi:DNA-binding NarL/FixJ family response regulator|nr:response regulator transcription factor [Bacteroidota bacterium]MBK9673548.1 response regulator transcription factor [Bacteroidota bacterium]MBK9799011.1 response regulator transcription factor [Bacteroidota bacterium]MBP6412648.1 response regulator transcription factor [Bacteroidia bacterium]